MEESVPVISIRDLYDGFDAPVAEIDCGLKCAPHNPSGKPFCCDICQAVPVAYHSEWAYLQENTDLWHPWHGVEGEQETENPQWLEDLPEHLVLLECKGPQFCQRPFRASSCRQFPFFPYVTSDFRFIGLAYEWEFEETCWVISNLWSVTEKYRQQFIKTYDDMFCVWMHEFESYANLSEDMREYYAAQKRRIPLLHRNGGAYLISPSNEQLRRVDIHSFKKFGPYRE